MEWVRNARGCCEMRREEASRCKVGLARIRDAKVGLAEARIYHYVQNVLNESEKQVFERFVDLGGRSAQQLGFSRSLGQIYAALYLTNKPTGLAELMKLLHISKGSASMGVRQLESLGIVRSVWVRGDRRDYYEVNTDFAAVLKHLVVGVIRPRIESAGNQLKDMQQALAADSNGEESAIMQQRLSKLDALRRNLMKVLPLLEKAL